MATQQQPRVNGVTWRWLGGGALAALVGLACYVGDRELDNQAQANQAIRERVARVELASVRYETDVAHIAQTLERIESALAQLQGAIMKRD